MGGILAFAKQAFGTRYQTLLANFFCNRRARVEAITHRRIMFVM
jgi:hypothetical protein